MDPDIEFKPGITLRRQLEDALRIAIRTGRLPPGAVLTPTRDLAEQLGISRGVIVGSYTQLAAEGYLEELAFVTGRGLPAVHPCSANHERTR